MYHWTKPIGIGFFIIGTDAHHLRSIFRLIMVQFIAVGLINLVGLKKKLMFFNLKIGLSSPIYTTCSIYCVLISDLHNLFNMHNLFKIGFQYAQLVQSWVFQPILCTYSIHNLFNISIHNMYTHQYINLLTH